MLRFHRNLIFFNLLGKRHSYFEGAMGQFSVCSVAGTVDIAMRHWDSQVMSVLNTAKETELQRLRS